MILKLVNVIKVGGSLSKYPNKLRKLCLKINDLSQRHPLLIIPGGAKFVDTVREYFNTFLLSEDTAHWMAILGMDQYGLLLSELIPSSKLIYIPEEYINFIESSGVPILLPYKYMYENDPLEHSWDVTSDSISLYIAWKLNSEQLILIKDVDGVYDKNGELLDKVSLNWLEKHKSCIDNYFPKIAKKYFIKCYVVSGLYPERLERLLDGKLTICTEIIR